MRSKYQPHGSKREALRHTGSTMNNDFVPNPSGPGMDMEKLGGSRQAQRLEARNFIDEYKSKEKLEARKTKQKALREKKRLKTEAAKAA